MCYVQEVLNSIRTIYIISLVYMVGHADVRSLFVPILWTFFLEMDSVWQRQPQASVGPHPPTHSFVSSFCRGHVMPLSPHVRQFAAASATGSTAKKTGKKHPVKAVLAGEMML